MMCLCFTCFFYSPKIFSKAIEYFSFLSLQKMYQNCPLFKKFLGNYLFQKYISWKYKAFSEMHSNLFQKYLNIKNNIRISQQFFSFSTFCYLAALFRNGIFFFFFFKILSAKPCNDMKVISFSFWTFSK